MGFLYPSAPGWTALETFFFYYGESTAFYYEFMTKYNYIETDEGEVVVPIELFEKYNLVITKDLVPFLKDLYRYAYKQGGQDQYDKMTTE